MAQLVLVLSGTTEGHGFSPRLGHIGEATTDVSHIDVSFSPCLSPPFLSLKISVNISSREDLKNLSQKNNKVKNI